MKRRKLASLAIAATCIVSLTACDDNAPEVDITLVAHNNGDGTTTVTGTAFDRDQMKEPVLVQVSVADEVLKTVGADEDRPDFKIMVQDGWCWWTCTYKALETGTKHGFTATIPTPKDPEAPVCVWTHGLANTGNDETGQPNKVTKSTTVCAKAKEVEKLTGSTTTSTSTTSTTTAPGATTTTEATTTTVAPTTTSTTPPSTTTTTMFVPPTMPSTTIPGPPMCPDPMDPSGPLIPC